MYGCTSTYELSTVGEGGWTTQECWGQVWSTSGILMGPPDSFVSSRGREGGQKMDGGTGVLGASLVNMAHTQDTGPPSELFFNLFCILIFKRNCHFLAYSNNRCIFVQLWPCEHEHVSHIFFRNPVYLTENLGNIAPLETRRRSMSMHS